MELTAVNVLLLCPEVLSHAHLKIMECLPFIKKNDIEVYVSASI